MATAILTQTAEFLNALYGQDPPGFRTVYTMPNKVSRWLEARQVDETISVSRSLTSMYEVYFGVGLQRQEQRRSQRGKSETVIAIPGLWLDLDIKGGAHTAENLPTDNEAKEFLAEFPLHPSILIHSGGGLYPFWLFPELWVFKDKVDHDQAEKMLTRFKDAFVALAASRRWKLDSTADLARVLRLPGMLNRKYSPPREVTMLEFNPDRRYTRDQIIEATDTLAGKVPKTTAARPDAAMDESLADAETIFEKCAFLRHCRGDAATLPEPEWYAMISIIARTKDGEMLCHDLSQAHPGYSERETGEKISHALKDTGPYTCERIQGDFCSCDGCRENVKSPIVLGRLKAMPAELAEKIDLLKDSSYAIIKGAFCFQRERNTHGGTETITERLCNFVAWQEEKRTLDDGSSETQQVFIMRGRTQDGRWLPEIEIPATGFAGLQFIAANWSPRAIPAAGFGQRDRLRESIELISQGLRERHIYTHTGWRQIGGKWVFLHAGGTIGGGPEIEVQLPKELGGYSLPENTGDLRTAIQASLRFLEVGKHEVTYPLWAAMWLAVVSEFSFPGFTIFLLGRTGLYKSTVAALALCHFGQFTDENLPLGWEGTANAMEKTAFIAKDLPLVIDDYAPEKDIYRARELERKANRLFRTTANRQGRNRMNSDRSTTPGYVPRCLTIVTGEQLPDGMQSIMARYIQVKFTPDSVNKEDLNAPQAEAGLYSQAMRGFVEWLLPKADELRDELHMEFCKYRDRALNKLSRVAGTAAHLQLGFMLGLKFAKDSGAIDKETAVKMTNEAWEIFTTAAAEQERLIDQEKPALLYLRGLTTLLIQGKAHLRDKSTDREPDQAEEWGWQWTSMGGRVPGGDFLGWVDDDAIYLLPEAAYKAISDFYRSNGGFPVSDRNVRDHLKEGGFTKTDTGRLTKTERVGKNTYKVLTISKKHIGLPPTESGNSGNSGNNEINNL